MTTATAQRKRSKVGLDSNGRIDWDMHENLSCFALAQFSPFYGKVIGKLSGGLSPQQVYERAKQFGGGLKSIRNGLSPVSQLVIKKYSVETMKPATARELLAALECLMK